MFPPVRIEKLEDAARGLWESLARAGDHLDGTGGIEDVDGQNKRFDLWFRVTGVSKPVKESLAQYARQYLRECGWATVGIRFTGQAVRIRLRRRR